MKRTTSRNTRHWSQRPQPQAPQVSRDEKTDIADTRESRETPTGLGPYEAAYDISLGYGHDRSIVVP